MKAYLELVRIDLKLAFRDKTVVFFNYLFPLIFFFTFAELMGADQPGTITYVVSMVLVLGILGNGLFGAGMRAVQERENNILRRYKVAPITPWPLLVASVVTGWVIFLPAVGITLSLGHFVYGMPFPHRWFGLLSLITLGLCAFRSLGLILASVANSVQESNILIQLFYMPMLFLSGATFPLTLLPDWAQIVSQFLPASYLVTGFQGIFIRDESLFENWLAATALILTLLLALFISRQLFRWEKEEKIRLSAKAWVLAVMLPFLIMGSYQAFTKAQISKAEGLWRDIRRNENLLIRDVRIFVGDGEVVEHGAVLLKGGKVAAVYREEVPDGASLQAETVEGAGKTLLPGLIDVHVHLGGPGGFVEDVTEYDYEAAMRRAPAAYLYSGVTAIRSVGDLLPSITKIAGDLDAGAIPGAELFFTGPLITAEGGHGTEYFDDMPGLLRDRVLKQFVRIPKSAAEARSQIDELTAEGVDGIKAVLEAGTAVRLFNRLDLAVFAAVVDEAHVKGLPVSVHTGNARDVSDALDAGVESIEHGSAREILPPALFQRMREEGTSYDPTLSVVEAIESLAGGDEEALDRSLVQQTVPPGLIQSTKRVLDSRRLRGPDTELRAVADLKTAKANLLAAYQAGVTLVAGTDSGNPLVFHGPSIHRELKLWVDAGVPPAIALTGATGNAALLLGAGRRIGLVKEGFEADLLLVDGNPLEDIGATERISLVIFKGERVRRSKLFSRDTP